MIAVKRNLAALALASVLHSAAALAESLREKAGVDSILGIAPKTEDFIKEAATSDMLEIEAGKWAQFKGTPDEKKFAAAMITYHTRTSADLEEHSRGRDGGGNTDRPRRPLPEEARRAAEYRRRAAFSRQKHDPMQVSAHKEAVSLFERYAKGGGDDPQAQGLGRGRHCRACNTISRWPKRWIKTANSIGEEIIVAIIGLLNCSPSASAVRA